MLSKSFYLKLASTCKNLFLSLVVVRLVIFFINSITKEEQLEIEWVQKCALRIILKDNYTSYEDALNLTGLETLKTRRNKLSLSFAIKCTKNEATRDMFPRKNVLTNTRSSEKFVVTKSSTERLANSAIPFMQRLLNKHEQKKTKWFLFVCCN